MSDYARRVDALADGAARAAASVDPPADPPDADAAATYLREGVAPALAVYVEARTGAYHRFEPSEYERLEAALNDYLEAYARCHGVEMDARFSLRTAAELLLDTRDVADVAAMLTGVPG